MPEPTPHTTPSRPGQPRAQRSAPTRPAHLALLLLTFCLLLLTGLPSANAQDAESVSPTPAPEFAFDRSDGYWKLTAQRLDADQDAHIVNAYGGVRLDRGADWLRADFGRYFLDTRWVYLRGSVEVHIGNYTIYADEAEFDLNSKSGWMRNGRLVSEDPPISLRSDRVDRLPDGVYRLHESTVTSCQGDVPAWSINVDQAEVTIEDTAKLWGPSFRILDTPVFFFPFITFSISTERESGLLWPTLGSSSRDGFKWNQPIYWAIDKESDLTFYENLMSRRGLMQGFEYRATPDVETETIMRFDWLHDQIRATSESNEDKQFQGDGLIRPNNDRYWLRGMYDGRVTDSRWTTKMTLDMVSDQNYLREFSSGLSGFTKSRNQLLNRFGRDLDVADSLTRTSTALFSRGFADYGGNVKMAYTQNLSYLNDNEPSSQNPTAQRVPELTFFAYKQRIPGTWLEWQGESELTYFWRRYGTKSMRADVFPQISLPMPSSWVSLIPTVGWRQTTYFTENIQNVDGENVTTSTPTRGLPQVDITAFSDVYRVFELDKVPDPKTAGAGTTQWTRIRHALQPRISYGFRPRDSQGDLPNYDEKDRLAARNELTYSLTNIFDRRRDAIDVDRGENGDSTRLTTDYLEFLRVRLEQGYDFYEASRTEDLSQYPRRPFTDILGEVIISPRQWLALDSKTFFSPYLGEITEHEHTIILTWPERGRFSFGLDFIQDVDEFKRQERERLQTLEFAGDIYLSRAWELGFGYVVDQVSMTDVEKMLGLTYHHQCFTLEALFTQTPYDDSFELRFELAGLSSAGLNF